jgi:hypothetical protein
VSVRAQRRRSIYLNQRACGSVLVRTSVLALSILTVSQSFLSRRQMARSQPSESDGDISTSLHNARPTPCKTSETPSSSSGQDAYENETLSQEQRLAQMLSGPNFSQSLRRQVQCLPNSSAPLFPSLSCPLSHVMLQTSQNATYDSMVAFRASGSK